MINPKKMALFFIFILVLIQNSIWAMILGSIDQSQRNEKKWRIIVLPVLFYMPETKWGGGAGGLITYRSSLDQTEKRPSSIYFYAIYTQLKQFSSQIKPELYFREESYLLNATIMAETFPDKFWGIGPHADNEAEEDYTPRTYSLEFTFQKKVWPKQNLYAGLHGLYENYRVIKYEAGKLLAKNTYLGSRGGTTSSLGFILSWDMRDNIFFPHRGHYFQFITRFSRQFLGSDFNTTLVKLDLRKYFPLFGHQVLAWQLLFQAIGGSPPFKNYAKLGGDSIMRGYYSGRYRDKYLLAIQGEGRLFLWRRWGMIAFAGVGDVSPSLGKFKLNQSKYSLGLGLRFKILPKEGTNLRFDLAWGKGTSGFYFSAGEAF